MNGTLGRRVVAMRWLLGVSIAANLFFVAFNGVHAWRGRHRQVGKGDVLTEEMLPRVLEQLPPEDRRMMGDAFGKTWPTLVGLDRQSKTAWERVGAGIVRPEVDERQIRIDWLEAREARQKFNELLEETLLPVLPRLSREGRGVLGHVRVRRP